MRIPILQLINAAPDKLPYAHPDMPLPEWMEDIARAAVLGYVDVVPFDEVFDQPTRYVWASQRNGVDYAWRLDPGEVWTIVAVWFDDDFEVLDG